MALRRSITYLNRSAYPYHPLLAARQPLSRKFISTSGPLRDDVSTPARKPRPLPARWLGDVKTRLASCLTWGCTPQENLEAAQILEELAGDWRDYVVGVEGYLTDPERVGLFKHCVEWGKMDSFGHVNNVVYSRWAESGRVNTLMNFAKLDDPKNMQAWKELMTPRHIGLIMKSIKLDYKFPVTWPDRITVVHKISGMGKESFTLDAVVMSEKHQRIAARVEEDIVVYDYKENSKIPIPDWIRSKFSEALQMQEKHAEECRLAAEAIEKRVKVVEECFKREEK